MHMYLNANNCLNWSNLDTCVQVGLPVYNVSSLQCVWFAYVSGLHTFGLGNLDRLITQSRWVNRFVDSYIESWAEERLKEYIHITMAQLHASNQTEMLPKQRKRRRRALIANEKTILPPPPWGPRTCQWLYYNRVPHVIHAISTWKFHKSRDQRIIAAGGTFSQLERQILSNDFEALDFGENSASLGEQDLECRTRTAIRFNVLSPEELAAVAKIQRHEDEQEEVEDQLRPSQMA